MRRVKMILIVLMLLATCRYKVEASSSAISKEEEEDLELERQLKLINKPPIKSIQTEYGHIVDCIEINKQLAFDHPLLKNHKLQMKPRFLHENAKINGHGSPSRTYKIGLEKDLCPTGSVPIRRTTKEDLIGAKSLSNNKYFPGSHFAALKPRGPGNSYYGVNGILNVYNPRVQNDQMSVAQTWVQSGDFDEINTILSGWQVAPQLYDGEMRTHLFALWTSDTFKKTGCYNVFCPGFVQIDKLVYLGTNISPVSTYGGRQYEISVSISQDPDTKNWWLIVQDTNIGYYPAELFSNMSSADQVGWGGRVSGPINGSSPEMGSGHFPDGDYRHACFFRQISYQNGFRSVEQPKLTLSYVDNPTCYALRYYQSNDSLFGHNLHFGGPGGNCGN